MLLPSVLATTPSIGHLFTRGIFRGRIYVGKVRDPETGEVGYQTVSPAEWKKHPKNPDAKKATTSARRQASTNETRVANANKNLRAQGKNPTLAEAVKEAERQAAKRDNKRAGIAGQEPKAKPLKGETPRNSQANANPGHLQPNSIKQDRPLVQEKVNDLRRQTQGPTLKGTNPQARPATRSAPPKPPARVAQGKGVIKPPNPTGLHSQIIRTFDGGRPGRIQPALTNSTNALAKAAAKEAAKGGSKLAGRYALPIAYGAAIVDQAFDVAGGFKKIAEHPFLNGANAKPTGTRSGRTGRGGTTYDDRRTNNPATDGRYIPGNQQVNFKAAASAPAKATPAAFGAAAPAAPSLPSPQRVRLSVGAPTVRGSSSTTAAPQAGRAWSDFNPGRGTSETNNPLIQKDPYLLGKIKEREGKATSKAIEEGRASKAEYNISQEEGNLRLSAAAPKPAAAATKLKESLLDQLRKKKKLRGAGYDLYDLA